MKNNEHNILKTHIAGFDALLHGGIHLPHHLATEKNGLIILLKGAPGSGKTTFSSQLICSWFLSNETFRKKMKVKSERVNYYSLDQSYFDIVRKVYKTIYNNNRYKAKLKISENDPDLDYEYFLFNLKAKYWLRKIFLLVKDLKGMGYFFESEIEEEISIKKEEKEIYKLDRNFIDTKKIEQLLDDKGLLTNQSDRSNISTLKNISEIGITNFLLEGISDYLIKTKVNPKEEIIVKILNKSGLIDYDELELELSDSESVEQDIFPIWQFLIKVKYLFFNLVRDANVIKSEVVHNIDFIKILSAVIEGKSNEDIQIEDERFGDFYKKFINNFSENPSLNKGISTLLTDFQVYSTKDKIGKSALVRPGGLPLSSALALLNSIPEQNENTFLTIVDGVNSLNEEESGYFNLQNLITFLRQKSKVSLIAYDPSNKDSDYIDYIADLIIDLRLEKITEPVKFDKMTISIPKSRYQNAIRGSQHQYKIRNYGLVVFPYLHFYSTTERTGLGEGNKPHLDVAFEKSLNNMNINSFNFTKINPTKESSIIDKILNGIYPDSVTALIGPRRTSKTILSMDFLKSKLNTGKVVDNESRLLVSIIDNAQTIINERDCKRPSCVNYPFTKKGYSSPNETDEGGKCYEWDNASSTTGSGKSGSEGQKIKLVPKKTKCFNGIYLYHFQPLVITGNELLFQIDKRIKESAKKNKPITRLAFFDFTQLEYRFPNIVVDPYFIPAFMDYLKTSRYVVEYKFKKPKDNKIKCSGTRKYNNNKFEEWIEKIEISCGQKKYVFNLFSLDKEDKMTAEVDKDFAFDQHIDCHMGNKKIDAGRDPIVNEINTEFQNFIGNEQNQKGIKTPFDAGYIKTTYNEEEFILQIEFRISAVFMLSGSAELTKSISVLSDNVIFLWRDKLKKKEELMHKPGLRKGQNGKLNEEKDENVKPGSYDDYYLKLRDDKTLCLYVDRCEGDVLVESDRLFAFPIRGINPVKEEGKRKSNVEVKTSPLSDFELEPTAIKDFCFSEASYFKYAENEIAKITSLQGIKKYILDYDMKKDGDKYNL